MIEVTGIRLLLPAIVDFTKDGVENSRLVYIDQMKLDVFMPDMEGIEKFEEFKQAFAKFYNSKSVPVKIPSPPKTVFEAPKKYEGI